MITISKRIASAALILFACSGVTASAGPLILSGSLVGTASESLTGRCAPFITVTALATGTSTVLGAFADTQSHCTTSLTSFGGGLFKLTATSDALNTIFGTYSGTAALGSGGILDFSADLRVNGGSGLFTNRTGDLLTTGTLDTTGVYKASFSGTLTATPEPGTFAPALWSLGLLALLLPPPLRSPKTDGQGWARRSLFVACHPTDRSG